MSLDLIMKQSYLILLSFFLIGNLTFSCASSEPKEENEPGLMQKVIDKAQSEEGQKAIKMGKEKLEDPATQEKLKSMMSKDKEKKK